MNNIKPRIYNYYRFVVAEDLLLLYNAKTIESFSRFKTCEIYSRSEKFFRDTSHAVSVSSTAFFATHNKSSPKRARKSIAQLNVRSGNVIAVTSLVSGMKVWTFLDRILLFVLNEIVDKKPKISQNWRLVHNKVVQTLELKELLEKNSCYNQLSLLSDLSSWKKIEKIDNFEKALNQLKSQKNKSLGNLFALPELTEFFPFFDSRENFYFKVAFRNVKFFQNSPFFLREAKSIKKIESLSHNLLVLPRFFAFPLFDKTLLISCKKIEDEHSKIRKIKKSSKTADLFRCKRSLQARVFSLCGNAFFEEFSRISRASEKNQEIHEKSLQLGNKLSLLRKNNLSRELVNQKVTQNVLCTDSIKRAQFFTAFQFPFF